MNQEFEAFKVESSGNTMIVIPQGDSHGFRYETLHREYNALHRMLDDSELVNLLVELGSVEFMGSVMLGVIIRLSRKVSDGGGRVVLCCASEQMEKILESQNLSKVWPQYSSRDEALKALDT